MPGINLSQSATQNEQARAGTSGRLWIGARLIWSAVLILIAVAIWGGLTYYDGRLQSDIDGMTSTIREKEKGFSGEDVDRVADFVLRTGLLEQNLTGKADASSMLTDLQGVMLDSVVLSKYSYDKAAGIVEMSGTADSFRGLAQQLVAFRKLPKFSSLSVGNAKRLDGGTVDFDVKVTLR